jgi:hypothetical protein
VTQIVFFCLRSSETPEAAVETQFVSAQSVFEHTESAYLRFISEKSEITISDKEMNVINTLE